MNLSAFGVPGMPRQRQGGMISPTPPFYLTLTFYTYVKPRLQAPHLLYTRCLCHLGKSHQIPLPALWSSGSLRPSYPSSGRKAIKHGPKISLLPLVIPISLFKTILTLSGPSLSVCLDEDITSSLCFTRMARILVPLLWRVCSSSIRHREEQ